MTLSNELLLLLAVAAFNPGVGSAILTTNTLLILLLFTITKQQQGWGCCTNNFPCQQCGCPSRTFV